MWEATTSDIPGGSKYGILENGADVSFRQFFELLCSSVEFADWYSGLLGSFDAKAVCWELPPLTNSTIDGTAEFVLLEAPFLAHMRPEPAPFAAQFDRQPGGDVVVFPNLGGDAVLVVPCPLGPVDAYPHLAAFLRQGRKDQVRALWRATAETVLDRLDDEPTWLSTAGGGVAWLHMRLDSRPKYYSYRAYTEWEAR